jgi:hypothetical protein
MIHDLVNQKLNQKKRGQRKLRSARDSLVFKIKYFIIIRNVQGRNKGKNNGSDRG